MASAILSSARRPKGFTLVEVLVVLILVSIIATLLIQGVGIILSLRYRAVNFVDQQQHNQLRSAWVTALLNGLVPDRPGRDHLFKGSPNRLDGLSIQTLSAPIGLPRHIILKFEQQGTDTVLSYQQDRIQWLLGRWPTSKAVFNYLDPQGQWHDHWPPKDVTEYSQLPMALMLQVGDAWSLFAVVQGRKSARVTLSDELLGQTAR